MNSYNDNLRSAVVDSLNVQEASTESSKAKSDAACLTMFYAEGAKITAKSRLDKADATYYKKKAVSTESVDNSNISSNVLSAATKENALTAQCVTNAATSAGNIQIATTAIVKLASDVGSIFNIVDAANFNSEIFKQATLANTLIGQTAFNAEKLSNEAMEASASTASISSSQVENLATVTDASIKEMETITAAELEEISATVDADNEDLAQASIAEKAAEGTLEEAIESYTAIAKAYDFSNETQNLDITVEPTSVIKFKVSFKPFEAAFDKDESKKKSDEEKDDGKDKSDNYPVKGYYVMVAKDSEKSTFSSGLADGIYNDPTKSKPVTHFNEVDGLYEVNLDTTKIKDIEGASIECGDNYVVFVYAVFDDTYKNIRNDFSNFLSAPSMTFKLQIKLRAAQDFKYIAKPTDSDKPVLQFKVNANKHQMADYLCMFLPHDAELTKDLLTNSELSGLARKIEKQITGFNKNEAKILKLEGQILSEEAAIEELKALNAIIKNDPNLTDKQKKTSIAADNEIIKNLQANIKDIKSAIKALRGTPNGPADAGSVTVKPGNAAEPNVLFNMQIAENIPPANYIRLDGTKPYVPPSSGKKDSNSKDKAKPDKPEIAYVEYRSEFHPETTDCFGNRLDFTKQYFPVVLSVSNKSAEMADGYINRLSSLTNQPLIPTKLVK